MKLITTDELEAINELSTALRIPEAVIEKDVYTTLVIQELSAIRHEMLSLVFAGGTCLSKGHQITNRMSEDIDFKVVVDTSDGTQFSKNAIRNSLSQLKDKVEAILVEMGLSGADIRAQNENRYIQFAVDYPARFHDEVLRPHIQIELITATLRREVESRPIEAILNRFIQSTPTVAVPVVNVEEIAAEKVVSFTRRTAEFIAHCANGPYDTALVRHLIDLHQIDAKNAVDFMSASFRGLVTEIAVQDGRQYRNFPGYANDYVSETRNAMNELVMFSNKYKNWYDAFVERMVFDTQKPSYEEAVALFRKTVNRCFFDKPGLELG